MDRIHWLNRVVESSPVIIVILLAGYFACWRIFRMLLCRLDKKDEQIMTLNTEMLAAINAVNKAVERLTDAILYQAPDVSQFRSKNKRVIARENAQD
jgi:hypothetical protein